MRCDVAQRELSARMDGAHDRRLDEKLDAHLGTCARCQRFQSGSHKIRDATRLQVASPVPDLVDDIMHAVEAGPSPADVSPRQRTTLAAVAGIAAVAIAVLAFSLAQRTPNEPVATLQQLRARTLLVWTPVEVTADLTRKVARTDGVAAMTQVRSGVVWLDTWTDSNGTTHDAPDGMRYPIEVASIDTDTYGRFVPHNQKALLQWLARDRVVLGDGGAALRHIDDEGTLTFGKTRLRVEGVIDDDLIGSHEAVVGPAIGRELDIQRVRYLLLELDDDATTAEVEERIDALSKAIRVRTLGQTPRFRHGDAVLPPVRIKELFGEFAAAEAGNGNLRVDDAWTQKNITSQDVPVLGPVRCHRRVFPQLQAALDEISSRGLDDLMDDDFGGCFFPRYLSQTDHAGISHHSWGIALDVNVKQNPFGQPATLDPRVVDVFERWGFTWGGRWLIPDGMHFEFLRFPPSAKGSER